MIYRNECEVCGRKATHVSDKIVTCGYHASKYLCYPIKLIEHKLGMSWNEIQEKGL